MFGDIGEVCDIEFWLEVIGPIRVENLASGERRRHWLPDEKARIVAAPLAPGAKVSAVARKHGIYKSRQADFGEADGYIGGKKLGFQP